MGSKKSFKTYKEQVKEFNQNILNGVKDVATSTKWMEWLKLQSRFHSYSANNTFAIFLIMPGATRVMGKEQWLKEFNRTLIEGEEEKGIAILAPSYKKVSAKPYYKASTMKVNTNISIEGKIIKQIYKKGNFGIYSLQIERIDGKNVSGYINISGNIVEEVKVGNNYIVDGTVSYYRKTKQIKAEEITPCICEDSYKSKRLVGFRPVIVYDISQTEGDPLPNSICNAIEGNSKSAKDILCILDEIVDIPILWDEEITSNGYFHPTKLQIGMKKGLSDNHKAKTLIHEYSHYYLHKKKEEGLSLKGKESSERATEEIIVESIAYITGQYYGLDTSEYSFEYITSWSNADPKEVKKLASMIQKFACEIIEQMEKAKEKIEERQEVKTA